MAEYARLGFEKLGLYFSHSTVCQINYSLSEVLNCRDKYLVPIKSEYENRLGYMANRIEVMGLDELAPLLVCGHERDHYCMLTSTPCGLLLWRCINALTGGLLFVARKIGTSNAKYTCFLPLTEWYFTIGRKELQRNPPLLSEGISRRLDQNQKLLFEKHMPSYIDEVFYEINTLTQFLNAFQGDSSMTMEDFVNLANEAFCRLAIRSDLKLNIEWKAHNPSLPHYLPKGGFTLNEILEANARFWELDALQKHNVSKKILDQWKENSIFGVYKPVFDWLYYELADPAIARLAIDIALTTPIDLCCSNAIAGQL